MQFYILENILIKEISEDEYRKKHNYINEKKLLYEIMIKAKTQNVSNFSENISQEVQTIINDFRGQRRNFCLSYEEKYIGYISFAEYDSISPEIQITIAEDWRNKGIGYQSLKELIKQLFDEREDIKYFLYCVKHDNYPSIKLVEKLGGKINNRGDDFLDKFIKRYCIYR